MIGASDSTHRAARSRAAVLERDLAAAGLDWIVPHWRAPDHVMALTTTRSGATTRERIADFVPSPPIWLRQVHGNAVALIDDASLAGARNSPPVADAAVTRLRGVVCAVETADCLPVLFADRRGDAIGVAHAGWRGLSGGVLEATVAALVAQGASADELLVWFGPAIGPGAFEVGSDVHAAFCASDYGAETCFVPHREGKWHADLYALARRRLATVGVHDVKGGDWCTYSDATRFHSYRRERATGRMATLAWLASDTKL